MPAPESTPVRVWDVPTRLVHWAFVAGVGFSWWTAENGRLDWHLWSGYTLLALVLFRLYWGFFGASTARFSRFVRGPRAIGEYLRGAWRVTAGHNPLGALSVIALLVLLLVQVVLGLFAVDIDGLESGPLSSLVSFSAGRTAAEWHEWVFNALMTLVFLHVLAVLYYLFFKRQNLVGAMVSGRRRYTVEVEPLTRGSVIHLIIGIVLSVGVTWWVSKGLPLG